MIHHVANRVLSARSWTRILAFVLQTGLVAWTLGVKDTLWSTGFVWIADVFWQTFAIAVVAYRV